MKSKDDGGLEGGGIVGVKCCVVDGVSDGVSDDLDGDMCGCEGSSKVK